MENQHLKNNEKMMKKSKNQFFHFCLYLVPMMSESCFSMFGHAKSDFFAVYRDALSAREEGSRSKSAGDI